MVKFQDVTWLSVVGREAPISLTPIMDKAQPKTSNCGTSASLMLQSQDTRVKMQYTIIFSKAELEGKWFPIISCQEVGHLSQVITNLDTTYNQSIARIASVLFL